MCNRRPDCAGPDWTIVRSFHPFRGRRRAGAGPPRPTGAPLPVPASASGRSPGSSAVRWRGPKTSRPRPVPHRTAPESCVQDGTGTHHGLTKNRRCTKRDARRGKRLSGRACLDVDPTRWRGVGRPQPGRPSDALAARDPLLPGEADPRRQAVWNQSVRVAALDGDSAVRSSRARGRLKYGRTL